MSKSIKNTRINIFELPESEVPRGKRAQLLVKMKVGEVKHIPKKSVQGIRFAIWTYKAKANFKVHAKYYKNGKISSYQLKRIS